MKFVSEKNGLLEALQNVQRGVSPKSPMPALEGILFSAEDGGLTLTGYDLDMAVKTKIPAQITEPGAAVLNARLIVDIVRRLPQDTVSIECDPKNLCSIKSGRSNFSLMGIPAEEFPQLPTLDLSTAVTFPQYLLKDMIGQTRYAISQSDSMPVHKGSLFALDGESFDLVSVDGCRLALRTEPFHTEQPLRFIVPGKTLSDVEKMLSDDRESNSQVTVCPSAKHVLFELGAYEIVTRLLEGNFLDYKNVIPKNCKTTVTLNTREMIDATERASLIIEDRLKNPLRCRFEDNAVTLTVNTTMGRSEDAVDCAIDGEPVDIGFNSGYLLEALKNTNCDQVTMRLSGPITAMTLSPSDGNNFVFLVLPVRIKG